MGCRVKDLVSIGPSLRAFLALGGLGVICSLALAPTSRSAEDLSGLYVVVDGPKSGALVRATDDGRVAYDQDNTFAGSVGSIRRSAPGCRSLHFRGRIGDDHAGRSCWKVVPYPRASPLLHEMVGAIGDEERARHVNNQRALQNLRSARRDLEKAFDRIEKAARAGDIGEAKFERLKDDFVDIRRIDEAAETALKANQKLKAREILERALDLKHTIVDALARDLLVVQPPDLKPLQAEFMPAQSQTTYTQRATNPDGRDLRYHWTLVEHNDFTCINFEPNRPRENQAIWHHGDNQGCSHNLEGPRGHVGTITVVVRDGKFECVAIYDGSRGPNGANEGEGPEPPRCQPTG